MGRRDLRHLSPRRKRRLVKAGPAGPARLRRLRRPKVVDAVCPGPPLGDAAAGARAARRSRPGGLRRAGANPSHGVFQETAATWRKELARSARFTFPDPLWERTFARRARGSLSPTTSSTARPALPWGTRSRYRDFYLRDGARVVRALDLLDRADLAAEGIDELYEFQLPDGPVPLAALAGQLDGSGPGLWALDQHLALTGDKALLDSQAARPPFGARRGLSRCARDPVAGAPPDSCRMMTHAITSSCAATCWARTPGACAR